MTLVATATDADCNLCLTQDYEIVGRTDRRGRALQTVICRCCGLVWTNPRPSGAEIERYYATTYRTDYTGTATPAPRKVLRGMLGAQDRRRALRPLLRDGTVLLDVGCGAGEFVYLLRRHRVEASGLEPGLDYAAFAREVLGIPVHTATVETAPIPPGSQDVITMFHCLEHMSDPRHTLASARGWLKRGGVLVVEVPNVESTVQAPRHRYHFAHLYHFSGATLAALGEAAGLRHVRTYLSEDGGNVTCVFRRGSDEERGPIDMAPHFARTRDILAAHTPIGHYLSATPYLRALRRLRRRWREDRLLQRLPTVDAVVRWAAEPGPDHL